MSLSQDPTIRGLDACDCCEGIDIQTPEVVQNRPGLSEIAYRIGTHSRFKESMLSRLSSSDFPALKDLTSRADGDFSTALLDAWAAAADVLAFYQERIANEGYLRTATELFSLIQLANLVGYVPRPGVAASAYLAFTLDSTSLPDDIPVPVGTRVQSIPGPGEKPQIFETIEAIAGRPEWNAIKPRLLQPHPTLTKDTDRVTVRGVAVNIQKGDNILLVCGAANEDRPLKQVITVAADPITQTTRIDLKTVPVEPLPYLFPILNLVVWNPLPLRLNAPTITNHVLNYSWHQADLTAYAAIQKWPVTKLAINIRLQASQTLRLLSNLDQKHVLAFRQKTSIFGHNAPKYSTLPDSMLDKYPGNWDSLNLATDPVNTSTVSVDLDSTYPGIVEGSWVVLRNSFNLARAYQVMGYSETSRADFTLTGKVSRITLDRKTDFSSFGIRDTTVFAQSEELSLAELPITETIKGDKIVLDGPYLGLKAGRPVIVSGKRTDLPGVTDSEVMFIKEITFNLGYTQLTFINALANEYERASVTLNANVALATHGETRMLALGSGDANAVFQKFNLPETPLTHLLASNDKGSTSTLQVRVNQLLWQEVDFLYGLGPDEQVYITREDDQGHTVVQFGDGKTGARLPTGQENVQVMYRKGSGAEGLVKEGQLSLLLTKPLGVRSVMNPVAAGDAAGAESLEDVRRNALLPIRTLGRIVSLLDYEDFAHAFTGVAKALATWTWDGHQRGVFVSVAGTGGKDIPEDSLTYKNLISAMLKAGDPSVPLHVVSYSPAFFHLAGKIKVDPAYLSDQVLAGVVAALRGAFSFDARSLGQPVARSEVIAVMQSVSGVLAVDLDAFYRVDATAAQLAQPMLADRLIAQLPRAGSNATRGAELLTLDPRPIPLEVLSV
jgi:predicted phage baseplate assembly protein